MSAGSSYRRLRIKKITLTSCHLLDISRTTSNTYLNGEKVVFLVKASGRGIPPPPPPASSVLDRSPPKISSKKKEGKISHKKPDFSPTETPNPLMESPYKTGYKNGTFAALKGAKNTNLV